jgi:rhomboid-like protein
MVHASLRVRQSSQPLPPWAVCFSSPLLSNHSPTKTSDKLVPVFLPQEWRESVSARGSVVLAAIVAFELFNLVSPFKVARLDHWAHLGGYCAGAAWAVWWKAGRERTRQRGRGARWFEPVVSGSR